MKLGEWETSEEASRVSTDSFLADTMLAQTVRSNGAVSIDVDRAAMKKVD